jgi:signal transduction histidine kinase
LCNAVNGNIQINLYRILQEQIKNIVKYADASEIEITVTQAQDTIMMRIYDNGKGFDVKTAKKGIGLSNIKKRAESFSGKFILNSAKGKGCEILLELPLAKAS